MTFWLEFATLYLANIIQAQKHKQSVSYINTLENEKKKKHKNYFVLSTDTRNFTKKKS